MEGVAVVEGEDGPGALGASLPADVREDDLLTAVGRTGAQSFRRRFFVTKRSFSPVVMSLRLGPKWIERSE